MCTFGGDGLDILFVTSGTRFLDERGRAEQPLAGGLFAVHRLDAKGLPEPFFEDGPGFISRVHDLPSN
jgi:sugar lactone lactonase YvrE